MSISVMGHMRGDDTIKVSMASSAPAVHMGEVLIVFFHDAEAIANMRVALDEAEAMIPAKQ